MAACHVANGQGLGVGSLIEGEERVQKEAYRRGKIVGVLEKKNNAVSKLLIFIQRMRCWGGGSLSSSVTEKKKKHWIFFHDQFLCCTFPQVALLGVPRWDWVKKCESHLSYPVWEIGSGKQNGRLSSFLL